MYCADCYLSDFVFWTNGQKLFASEMLQFLDISCFSLCPHNIYLLLSVHCISVLNQHCRIKVMKSSLAILTSVHTVFSYCTKATSSVMVASDIMKNDILIEMFSFLDVKVTNPNDWLKRFLWPILCHVSSDVFSVLHSQL